MLKYEIEEKEVQSSLFKLKYDWRRSAENKWIVGLSCCSAIFLLCLLDGSLHVSVSDFRTDATQTGHILGAAAQRSRQAVPERKMSPATVAVLRFLLHGAMYQAANTNPQVII